MYSHEENFNIKRIQLNYRKQQLSNLHQPKLKKKKSTFIHILVKIILSTLHNSCILINEYAICRA